MVEAKIQSRRYDFLQNEPGDALYVIDEGKVRIWVRDKDAQQVTLSELEG